MTEIERLILRALLVLTRSQFYHSQPVSDFEALNLMQMELSRVLDEPVLPLEVPGVIRVTEGKA